jgi:hypothetical protein
MQRWSECSEITLFRVAIAKLPRFGMLQEPLSYIGPTTFADDTAVLATDSDPAIASQKLQAKTCLKNGE